MGNSYKNKHQEYGAGTKNKVNEQITVPQVQLVSVDGKMLGTMNTELAIRLAREEGMDLVEINPNQNPPIARIADYSKMQYREQRREKKARAVKASHDIKEIRIRPKTSDHDLDTKAKSAGKMLTKGHPLKITVMMRGRENTRRNSAKDILMAFTDRLIEYGVVSGAPSDNGATISIMMQPK